MRRERGSKRGRDFPISSQESRNPLRIPDSAKHAVLSSKRVKTIFVMVDGLGDVAVESLGIVSSFVAFPACTFLCSIALGIFSYLFQFSSSLMVGFRVADSFAECKDT